MGAKNSIKYRVKITQTLYLYQCPNTAKATEPRHILDPILSIGITLYILRNAYKNLKKTIDVILQAVPEGIDIKKIKEDVEKIDGIKSAFHIHVWTHEGENHVLTMHVELSENDESQKVMINKVKDLLKTKFFITHSTVEIEYDS